VLSKGCHGAVCEHYSSKNPAEELKEYSLGQLYAIDYDVVVEYHTESAVTDVPLLQHQFLLP